MDGPILRWIRSVPPRWPPCHTRSTRTPFPRAPARHQGPGSCIWLLYLALRFVTRFMKAIRLICRCRPWDGARKQMPSNKAQMPSRKAQMPSRKADAGEGRQKPSKPADQRALPAARLPRPARPRLVAAMSDVPADLPLCYGPPHPDAAGSGWPGVRQPQRPRRGQWRRGRRRHGPVRRLPQGVPVLARWGAVRAAGEAAHTGEEANKPWRLAVWTSTRAAWSPTPPP